MVLHNGVYSVYIHTNRLNGKMYVGCTKSVKNRWYKSGYRTSTKFYKAIQKYGWENFLHEVIASNLSKQEAENFEDLLIKSLRTNEDEFGYNTCTGGQSWLGRENPNYGKHTLSKVYTEDKELSKQKQSRKGKQNGRAVPCELYHNGKFVGKFDYQGLAAQYFKFITGKFQEISDSRLVARMRKPYGYMGYEIYPLYKNS